MENVCKEVRSRQTFPWQAVAFYGGKGKHVFIKSFLFFICLRKSLLACNGYGREKEEKSYSVFYREKYSLGSHLMIFLLPLHK